MDKKLNYSSEEILNIKFSPKEKGYNPLEVDQTYDKIIKDYETLNKIIDELTKANAKQLNEINMLKEKAKQSTMEIAKLKEKIKSLPKANGVTDDNYKLMKKIAAYERVLYRKGIDLKKALSDPDNC